MSQRSDSMMVECAWRRESLCVRRAPAECPVLRGEPCAYDRSLTGAPFARQCAGTLFARPRYDPRRRELWFGGQLVRCVAHQARNEIAILTAFEEQG